MNKKTSSSPQKKIKYKLNKTNKHLYEIFLGLKKGTDDEKNYIHDVYHEIGDKIYSDIIYIFSDLLIEDFVLARELCFEILNHKKELKKSLDRDMGFELSSQDYLINIKKILSNPKISKSSTLDRLTKNIIYHPKSTVYDTDILEIDINSEIQKFYSKDEPFSILYLDLDNLNEIYDNFGHTIGKEALAYFTGIIIKNIRKIDTIYRYDEENFIIILPGFNLEDAIKASLNLQKFIKKQEMTSLNTSLSVCIGITTFGHYGINNKNDLIDAADKAHFKAKNKENNKVCCYQGENKIIQIKDDIENIHILTHENLIVRGEVIIPGEAIGTIFKYKDILSKELELNYIQKDEIEGERQRIFSAIDKVKNDIIKMKSLIENDLDEEHRSILDAHHFILEDAKLLEELESELIERMVNSEIIVQDVFKRKQNLFLSMTDDLFRERSNDFADLQKRILMELKGVEIDILSSLPENSIIVAKRLLPSDTIHLKKKNARAIITEEGSKNSHSAIIAKALGIPYLSKIDKDVKVIPNNQLAIVDSEEGLLIINPDENYISKIKKQIKQKKHHLNKMIKNTKNVSLKYKNQKINIKANINACEDVTAMREYNCQEIGLFRTECIYLMMNHIPSEEFIYEQMKRLFQDLQDEVITIRLLDVGADKELPYLEIDKTRNPMLGLRGVRFLIKRPDILTTMLRAILRISCFHKVKILIPMVSLVKDITFIKDMIKKTSQQLKKEKIPFSNEIPVGAMIETPAAVFQLKNIIKQSDFISIGTNDLIQYTMAAGRDNDLVNDYYNESHDIIFEIIETIIKKAQKSDKECNLCGELAADLLYIEKLLKLGLRNFSVTPKAIPELKTRIMKFNQ